MTLYPFIPSKLCGACGFPCGQLDAQNDLFCLGKQIVICAIGTMRTGVASFDAGVIEVTVNSNGTLDVTDKATGAVYRGLLALEEVRWVFIGVMELSLTFLMPA